LPALRRTIDCLRVAAIALNDFEFDTVRCAAEAERGYLNATDLADLLVAAGVSFRDAHELVGRAVNRAIELGCELQALPPAEQKKLFPQLQIDLRQPLSAAAVLSRRDVLGGTAPQRVRDEVTRWQRELENWACNKETSR
jgi:argininosuccinate lyase